MNKCFCINSNTRAHGAGHADTSQVSTFCRRRFCFDDRIDQFLAVLSDLFRCKTYAADRSMNDTYFINFESDLTTFYFIDCICYIIGNSTCFRVWHQVTWT